ncbi:GNAT family N-acetyltransferase [Streptomyces profundus]|uniref:GNAT family N-acetyltransferase n=1 Tax=Streptomyces profundus TaxID=2867410 RepID=UPI001D164F2A|nr:GNAT family N-acetyltransferase [Streptomyces sp. MA3_2.13]UED82774.1 GNAT family N-acetyltransferase [Streptomyces sp. MA3_2.13]
MCTVERLSPRHGPAVLEFERENRAFFAASVPDRGDAYFAEFEERHRALLAMQDAGTDHFHVVVGEDGAVLGRVNVVDVAEGSAELGYRVAESAGGRGVATTAVRAVVELAAGVYGLRSLRAVTTVDNVASRAVLARAGFAEVGAVEVAGRPGLRFHRDLREG